VSKALHDILEYRGGTRVESSWNDLMNEKE
jgi:hypothetical protein